MSYHDFITSPFSLLTSLAVSILTGLFIGWGSKEVEAWPPILDGVVPISFVALLGASWLGSVSTGSDFVQHWWAWIWPTALAFIIGRVYYVWGKMT